MTDIALRLFQDSPTSAPRFDIALKGYDVATDDGLRTAVLLSLFTDRRAQADDAIEDGDYRGWHAEPSRGSRLWLLARAKETPDTLARAKTYTEEALAWLVEDGIARTVTVEAEWIGRGWLGLRVTIERVQGGQFEEVFRHSLGAT
jgi:phage gp46-like protein